MDDSSQVDDIHAFLSIRKSWDVVQQGNRYNK